MTTQAGMIPAGWLNDASVNESADSTVAEWVRTALNDRTAELEHEAGVAMVWSRGHWLTQDEIDHLLATIDTGV